MTLQRRDVFSIMLGAGALAGGLVPIVPAAAGEGYATGDMVLGRADAPVTVIEYASMTCPHCATFHNDTFADLKAAYIDTGKVRFIYREFPLDQAGLGAAMLARCAGEKRFFGFIDVLFRQQENWALSQDPIGALAKLGRMGGIGRERFNACLNDAELGKSIVATRVAAIKQFDVGSTPTFIVNGRKHAGAMTLEQFARVLDPLLPSD